MRPLINQVRKMVRKEDIMKTGSFIMNVNGKMESNMEKLHLMMKITIKQSLLNYGIYEGPQKEWWPNGNLRAARIMKNNEIDSEEIYAENGKHIVLYENIKDIGIVSHYNGKPFNGIMLAKHKTSLMGMRLPAHIEYEMVDGLKDGIKSEFYENGNIIKTLYSKDEFINIIAYFDFEGNNLIETETCLV